MLPSDFPTDKLARQRFMLREQDMREAKRNVQGLYRPQGATDGLWEINFQIDREDLAPGGGFSRIADVFTRKAWRFQRAMLNVSVQVPAKNLAAAIKMVGKELNMVSLGEETLCEGTKRVVVDMSKNLKVKAFVKRFDPTYRKRKVGFNIGATSVELHSGFWSGGSRTEWHGVLDNGDRYPLSYPTAPPQFGGGKTPTAKIGRGTFVAQGGTSSGKKATYTFHVTAEFAQAMGVS